MGFQITLRHLYAHQIEIYWMGAQILYISPNLNSIGGWLQSNPSVSFGAIKIIILPEKLSREILIYSINMFN